MPNCISIFGPCRLNGRVRVSGAKNSALPLLFASLLTTEDCLLENVPDLEDITVTLRLLQSLGAKVEYFGHVARIRTQHITASVAPYSLVKSLRASFLVLGPLLARCGEARVSLPGGDAIGARPVDLHLRGLVRMGADIRMEHGVVIARTAGKLRPAKIELDYPSVGATEHLLMTAATISGETVISGVAQEPEIIELAEFLKKMGADVEGAGSGTVRILGREDLSGAAQAIAGDRIEAATYLVGAAATGGKVTVDGISAEQLGATLEVLQAAGCVVTVANIGREGEGEGEGKGAAVDQAITVEAPLHLKSIEVQTAPFPSLATDVQPLIMAASTVALGQSSITETVFENRFGHVAEFRRFGANIELDGNTAKVTGVPALSGAPVDAGDIRAAAALVLMGLIAQGRTEIYETHHLYRGYEALVEKLTQLGARITTSPLQETRELVMGC